MNLSCRFSCLSKLTTTPEGFLLPKSHLYPSRNSSVFLTETHIPDNPHFHVKSSPSLPKPSFAILRIKNSKLTHPFATLSSFTEAEGEEEQKDEIQLNGQYQLAETRELDELPGMAQAFHISSSNASAISICIALAALTFPLLMSPLGQSMALKTKFLSYVTLLFGFYMAWNIGANDVANAMGTSVGSGALTIRQAVLTAAVLEFSGAFLMGTHVTSTMQKGILVTSVFQGKDSLIFAGLLSSLAAAGTWLQVSAFSFNQEGNSKFLPNNNGEFSKRSPYQSSILTKLARLRKVF